MQPLTVKHQIMLTLLDKGLLALLIVLAGYIANRFLERFKAEQVVLTETTRARIEAMHATWAEITGWRSFALAKSEPYQSDEEWAESKKQIQQRFHQAMEALERNRFLCGNEFSDAAMKYSAEFMQYYIDYVFTGKSDTEGIYAKLRERSLDISSTEKFLRSKA